ncbi:hypothetical protein GCM10009850_119560 [Nonomuraea monospora]|uniref:Thymidylate kinase n=1 Tax=Nonomuraea monospora TaxID=568818 RepID=A0ABN3D3T4_9ACTN
MIDTGNLLAEPAGEPGACPRAALARGAASTDAPTLVALSGPDAVGKTTQIRLLTRRLADACDAGPLETFDSRWRAAHEHGLARWWFTDAALPEVADVLACSYLNRARHARTPRGLVLIDRGPAMLQASVTATAAVRLGLEHARAAEHARALLAPMPATSRRRLPG